MKSNDYILTYTGEVYKQLPSHFLKISPWKDGEDRRVFEIENDNYRVITYKNACMIVNKQFTNTKEEWEYNGKKYVADPISMTDINQYTSLLKLLPNHSIIKQSKELLNNIGDNSLSIQSNDGLSELKLVKYKGKVYYIWIVNENLPRVRAYNAFGEFLQWCNIKHCKPIYNETDKRFV